ncbi:NF038143 family protein [Desulfobotulus sp. H1]|uniref:NF038143 family protein n=1 Tax=Desulfobotulus pelophilus TaxID=2823377 RepID=A0ABT3NCS1_9BACT|nr:NF038143 family protein [Desulfobotulus pelophilus]MCW7755259.1 NF038143 family protein [Desulfobotulus pelophilus]
MSSFEENYELILSRERRNAYVLAKELISKPEASVWMVLLPILFVHHAFSIQRYKKNIHGFADNFIKTRKKALDLAFGSLTTGENVVINLETCFPSLEMSAEKEKKVCEKQLEEIRILVRHYKELLGAKGKTYEVLVKNAYGTSGKFKEFLNQLEMAEKEVRRYVTKVFQTTDAAREVSKKIDKAEERIREKEAKEIF